MKHLKESFGLKNVSDCFRETYLVNNTPNT